MNLKFLLRQFKLYFFILAISVLSSVLTACVTVTPVVPMGDANQLWNVRSDYLYQQDNWDAQLSLIGVNE